MLRSYGNARTSSGAATGQNEADVRISIFVSSPTKTPRQLRAALPLSDAQTESAHHV
jgi:hypothetical protein